MLQKGLIALTLFAALAVMPTCALRAQWVQTNGIWHGYEITGFASNGKSLVATSAGNGNFCSIDTGRSWKNVYCCGFMYTPVWIGDTCFASGSAGAFGDYISYSTDNGISWSYFDNYYFSTLGFSITSLGVDSSNLYVGTAGGGIYRYDEINYWVPVNTGLPKVSGSYPTIRAFATMGTMLFAGTDNGLFRSTNQGKSWQSINEGLKTYYTSGCAGLVISDSILIYASYEGGVFTSTDGGTHWSPSNTGMPFGDIGMIAANGSNVFVSLYDADTSGLFRSTNSGRSWSLINRGLPGYTSINAISFCGSKIFVGTNCAGIYASSDSGMSWSNANNSDLIFQPSCSNLAANNDGIYSGIFHSTDDGANWTAYSCEGSGSPVIGAFGTNVYIDGGYSTDGGSTWIDAWKNAPYSMSSLINVGRNLFGGGDNGMLVSTDSGASWTLINSGLVHNGIRPETYQVPVDTFRGQINYKLDTAYDTVNFALRVNILGALDTILFAGTQGGLFYSTNYGSEWIPSDLGLTNVGTFAAIGNILFAGTGLGVWKLNGQGTDWDVTDSILIDSVTSLLGYETNLFACTAHSGVYLSKDSGRTWLNISTGLSSLAVWSIILKDSNLFVGTDSGIWRRPLLDFGIIPVAQTPPVDSQAQTLTVVSPQFSIFPNPFSQSTQISFKPESAGYADISIVNLLGEQVARIFSGELDAGSHNFTFSNTAALQDGTYECLVRMNGRVETLPIVLLH